LIISENEVFVGGYGLLYKMRFILLSVPTSHNGSALALKARPFGLPGSIPGVGVLASHNGSAPGSNPGPFGASPFNSGCERKDLLTLIPKKFYEKD
jgi:hypothetical protein